ncbi:hypothetical protein H8356DRAFT_1422944 [Neocallimastix lanati (nom. inval.)]|nr:hypothetical protein H8356DRAFT_1422944 [Neocallimastix sp. JGI-2020a]
MKNIGKYNLPRGLRRRAYKGVPLMQREDRGSSINDESRGGEFSGRHYTTLMIKYYLVKSFESTDAESVDVEMIRWNSLNFIDDLYVLFLRKIRVFNSLSSYDSISNFEDYIKHYIYLYLLGGTLVLNELHFDSGEQRRLNELLFKGSSESPVPKNFSFELLFDRYSKLPYLTNVIPLICRSFRLMMKCNFLNNKCVKISMRCGTDYKTFFLVEEKKKIRYADIINSNYKKEMGWLLFKNQIITGNSYKNTILDLV